MSNPLIDKLEELDEESVAKLYQNVFGSPEGQLVLEDLKGRCFIYQTTANADSHKTFWQEGMRSIMLHIQGQIDLDPMKPKTEEGE